MLSTLFLLGLGWAAVEQKAQRDFQDRWSAVKDGLPELAADLRDVESFGRVLSLAVSKEAVRPLSPARLAELRGQAAPFYRLYLLDAQAKPFMDDDQVEPPAWLASLARARKHIGGDLEVLRPLPPGYSFKVSSEPPAPANYLIFAHSIDHGRQVLLEADFSYLFGPWLKKRVGHWGLGSGVSWEVLPWEPGLHYTASDIELVAAARWTWLVPTLVPDLMSSLGPLHLVVDNAQVYQQRRRWRLSAMLAGIVLMGSLGVSLALTTRALQKREEYSQAKARFVSMVGHELRTPIAALEMYLEILRDGLVEDPAKIAHYYTVMARESGRLKNLVENLLTAGLAESGRLQFAHQTVELGALSREVVDNENRGGREVRLILPEEDLKTSGDRDALYGVWANLLLNALKYSDKDQAVELRLARQEEWAVLRVMDRGRGLPRATDYQKLFEPYVRADQETKGMGLGLALAKLVVEAHAGTITGEPASDGGSVFTVRLPGMERVK